MCFISHNRLIVIIAVLSIGLGILTFSSSALLIHHSEDLARVTVHFKFLIACTFCTIGAGIIQSVSSLLYVCRRVVSRDWIRTNAIVFGIFLIGISIAMVRFQSTLPGGFDAKVVANRTRNVEVRLHPDLNSTPIPMANSNKPYLNNTSTSSTVLHDEDSKQNEVLQSAESSTIVPKTKNDENEDKSDEVKSVTEVNQLHTSTTDESKRMYDIEEIVAKKVYLLKLYFGVIIFDFLALPIFLGLVSSKSSKFDLKGHSHIQSW